MANTPRKLHGSAKGPGVDQTQDFRQHLDAAAERVFEQLLFGDDEPVMVDPGDEGLGKLLRVAGLRQESKNVPFVDGRARGVLVAIPCEHDASRVRRDISKVFRYAMARGMIKNDPTPIKEALQGHKVKPYPVVTDPAKVGEILRAIDDYEGQKITKLGLQLLPILICRPGELRTLRWSEVHEDEIRLDQSRTKAGIIHVIPLSSQAKAILKELREITGHTEFCFPSTRSSDRAMSDNTLTAALRRMGFTKEELVPHSFRKIGSSALHEMGFDTLHIEKQLGHTDKNQVRATYNHATYLDARRQMLQAWADKLDDFKAG